MLHVTFMSTFCWQIQTRAHTHAHTRTYTHTHTLAHIHIRKHTHDTDKQHTHPHTHTHVLTHTHACVHSYVRSTHISVLVLGLLNRHTQTYLSTNNLLLRDVDVGKRVVNSKLFKK